MAETTDRPPLATEVPSAAPASAEAYRPLSLLALAGFGLAVVYALIVVIGAAIALFGRMPWLMPNWTFLLPLIALVVCWAARTRIRDSENTLSGLAFTTWGFRLTILIGLTYSAYYAATFFAVRGQAVDCADRFFDRLKKGQIEKAFALSEGIPFKDGDDAQLRNTIELRFNTPTGPQGTPGRFTKFRQSEFVRFIQTDGEKTNLVPLGVMDWEYAQGGYSVLLKYRVVTSLGAFEMHVKTFGRDSKPGEPKGLQWQILLSKGETGMIKESMLKTPHGDEVLDKSLRGHDFAQVWTEKVNRQLWGEAYLDTLTPAERARLRQAQLTIRLLATVPLAGVAPLGLCDAVCREYLAASQGLDSAKLIRIDKSFWAGGSQRKDILERVEKTFEPNAVGGPTFNLALQPSMPLIREDEGRITVLFDVTLSYLEAGGAKIQYVVEGRLVLVAQENETDRSLSSWRVAGIDIDSGRTPPTRPTERQPPPNAPFGAGMR